MKKRAITIVFMGIDGSGKTTQIDLFLEKLRGEKRLVIYVPFFSSERKVAGIIKSSIITDKLIHYLDKVAGNKLINTPKLILRLASIIVDSWLTRLFYLFKKRGTIIVYDRYYYDSLVAIALRKKSQKDRILKLSRLVPKPNIVILFEVKPEVAILRKPEHSIAEAKYICQLYSKLKEKIVVEAIDTEQSISQIQKKIENACVNL